MDQSRGVGHGAERSNGDGHSVTEKISETAQSAASVVTEQAQHISSRAQEIGADALETAEEYLRPIGLSLKERPWLTLTLIGGAGALLGAMWMSRSKRTASQQLLDQVSQLRRQSGW